MFKSIEVTANFNKLGFLKEIEILFTSSFNSKLTHPNYIYAYQFEDLTELQVIFESIAAKEEKIFERAKIAFEANARQRSFEF